MAFIADALLVFVFGIIGIVHRIAYRNILKKENTVNNIVESKIENRLNEYKTKKITDTKKLVDDLDRILKPVYRLSKTKKKFNVVLLSGIILAAMSIIAQILLDSQMVIFAVILGIIGIFVFEFFILSALFIIRTSYYLDSYAENDETSKKENK